MNVILADPTGLCFGVRRAIQSVEKALAENSIVYSLGSPIHNPQEVCRLQTLGLRVVSDEASIPDGAIAFIRAHGVAPAIAERLRARMSSVIDGTCPFVRSAQMRAKELSDAGYHVLVLGDVHHPEVTGILGHVSGKWTVISSIVSLNSSKLLSTIRGTSGKIHKLGLISQTTQREELLKAVAAEALSYCDELRVYNTICQATLERQQAVKQLAKRCDGIIVLGGYDSANTGKLFHIAKDCGCDVKWLEKAEELDLRWAVSKSVIGIAAGASTPDWLIQRLREAVAPINCFSC